VTEQVAAETWPGVEAVLPPPGPSVEVGVAAREIESGKSWAINGGAPFPAASTIKAAILVALYRAVDAGRVDFDQKVTVEAAAKVPGSGVLTWMAEGLALPLRDLAYLMIAISDNTASNLVIDAVGMEAVRATIADLGLRGTALNRRFIGRLPDRGMPENWTTATDLANLVAAISTNRAASPASCAAMRATLALQQHRARIPRLLPERFAYAGKTGSLPEIVHDAGLVTTPRGTLALAVLTRGNADPWAADELIGRVAWAAIGDAGLWPDEDTDPLTG
jgi:beta-lactamase class A